MSRQSSSFLQDVDTAEVSKSFFLGPPVSLSFFLLFGGRTFFRKLKKANYSDDEQSANSCGFIYQPCGKSRLCLSFSISILLPSSVKSSLSCSLHLSILANMPLMKRNKLLPVKQHHPHSLAFRSFHFCSPSAMSS